MKVQIIGNVPMVDLEEQIVKRLEDIVVATADRLYMEKSVQVNDLFITNAEFTVALSIEGQAEPQLLTVEHHEGHPEIFKWVVDIDKEEAHSNEEQSEFDEWTVSVIDGEEKKFKPVKSVYDQAELQLEDKEEYGNMAKLTFVHDSGFKVVKVYQDGNLIQEYKLTPKE